MTDRHEFIFNPDEYRSVTPVQIRFNDIDILGHLNNTVYFSIFDTGKAEYLHSVMKGQMKWDRVESVIANVNCSFMSATLYGEKVAVYTKCTEVKEKSFKLSQVLINIKTLEVKAVCETIMVSYDPDTKKSVPISENTRKLLDEFEGKNLQTPKVK